jgi:hypothetical protein
MMMTPSSSEREYTPPYTPTPTYASVARTQERARTRKYTHLRETLLSTGSPEDRKLTPTALQTLLSDPSLDLDDLRKLFGHLRITVLQTIWALRMLDLWIKRAQAMGTEYADALDEDGRCAKYTSRWAFFRDMDEELEVDCGEREGVVEVILRHVEVLRETVKEVGGRKEIKGRLLGFGGKEWKSEW